MAGTDVAGDNEFVSINLRNDFFSSFCASGNESDADDESANRKSFDSAESSNHGGSLAFIDEGLAPTFDNTPTNIRNTEQQCNVFYSDDEERERDKILLPGTARQKLKLVSVGSSNSTSSTNSDADGETQNRKRSAVDGLLFEIYDRYSTRENCRSIDSDNITECSTTSSNFCFASSLENDESREKFDRTYLQTKDTEELMHMVKEMRRSSSMLSSKLVRLLKQRDRNAHKLQQNFDMLTAILQAVSLKRRVDTRIRFSFIPSPGKKGFRQWHDAFKSVARLLDGIPSQWRKRTWVSLAEYCLKDENWSRVRKNCFNDRRNPEDDELDTQIVKDLHRTGCSWFFESDTEGERASLKRVLLAYARWNKYVGYCQGFNVIAALILQVVEGNEEDALKVMIYLVDFILPRNYFANNLRALSADMAVLRELMSIKLPKLSKHLDDLQKEAMIEQSQLPGNSNYEPPLVNVFTMQWFLTLFATCLPRETVLRIWDAVLLEGSEVLLRVALAIWAKLADYLNSTETAADFYMKMGSLLPKMMDEEFIDARKLLQTVFTLAPFPYRKIVELREKYTYDIHPFSTFGKENSEERVNERQAVTDVISDEEGNESETDNAMVGCLPFLPLSGQETPAKTFQSESERRISKTDIAAASPGAIGTDPESQSAFRKERAEAEILREKEKLDINHLQRQYLRMRKLQKKNMLVFNSFAKQTTRPKNELRSKAINHLFIDLPSFEKEKKTQRHTRYPFVMPPANGRENSHNSGRKQASNGSVEGNADRLTVNSMFNARDAMRTTIRNVENDYAQTEPLRNSNAKHKTNRQRSTQHDTQAANTDGNLLSMNFVVDKNAMYPTNFKPFPQRAQNPKSKLFISNQLGNSLSKGKQNKLSSSNPPVR